MSLSKGSITSKDLLFAVFCFLLATILRSGYIVGITRQDSWAMAITGFLFMLPIMAIYAALLRRFPGKNLLEMDDIIFGPVLGKAVSALYLFFFLSLAALNTRDLGNFIVDYLMPETPIAAVFLVFLIGCVYGIRKGIHNLMYLSTIVCIITVASVAINSILIIKDIHPGFLKPFFRLEPMNYVQGTVSVGTLPMGEVIVFLMLTPMLGKKTKAIKPLLLGLTFSALFMTLVVLRDIITLGPLVAIVSLPSFESVRYISLSGVLTRMESVYAVVLTLLFVFKISILLYAFALGLTQIFRRKSALPEEIIVEKGVGAQPKPQQDHPPFLLISAALVFFYSLIIFESVMENMDWGATTAPFFSLTFELLLPAVSLLVTCLRKSGKPREVTA
ncbi:GerAB/ArcD/ProY family transporter [Anaerotruncus rubiinfantis]|jgi:spore germination protein KB|uniref:GerAB/ArcD/ProY family transporter n=1 Tax=Anaerotruncus rubiinfantis TaxID=1720200 RepID=UPI00189A349B|nr:endospore germination permease [Anaerotruncus rubiinfantis]